jgi:hypothetical protein
MRIYKSNNEFVDYCDGCCPSESEAFELYGDMGDGPDDRGNCFAYDAAAPYYDGYAMPGEYSCLTCGISLDPEDHHSSWLTAILADMEAK